MEPALRVGKILLLPLNEHGYQLRASHLLYATKYVNRTWYYYTLIIKLLVGIVWKIIKLVIGEEKKSNNIALKINNG